MKTINASWLLKEPSPEEPPQKCEVCGKIGPTRVASSATGATSFRYCVPCLTKGREPYGALVASLIGMESMKDVADWYKGSIIATLKAEGKTQEELWKNVEAITSAYAKAKGWL